jgi:hypothetical protein
MENSTRFTHDCNCCVFIGHDDRGQKSDAYLCNTHDEVILRFGDEGHQYRALPREVYMRVKGG